MPKDGGTWEKTYFERAIQTSIGRALKTHYGVPQEVPANLSDLLRQIDEHDGNGHAPLDDDETSGPGEAASRAH